ncbi:MAG: FG-GAP repeat protein [Deltaproteobacteria bacterium]|nr:FG-GAP repeat protein [Deltaproteobacteria bacterium]
MRRMPSIALACALACAVMACEGERSTDDARSKRTASASSALAGWVDAVEAHIRADALRARPLGEGFVLHRPGLRALCSGPSLSLGSLEPGGWRLGLTWFELRGSKASPALDALSCTAEESRVRARLGEALLAEVENGPAALEQRFWLLADLGADFRLRARIEPGSLSLRAVEDGLVAVDESGAPRLHASRPRAWDARGVEIEARFRLEPGELAIEVRGAEIYPVFVDPAWTSIGEERAESRYGWSVAGAGDVDHDGYDDVLVAAPWFSTASTSAGKVYLYYGGPEGLADQPAWTSSGDDHNRARFGASLAAAGDVNGDGYADVVIGTDGQGTSAEGKAFVFHGSFNGLPPSASWSATGDNAADARFGKAVSSAGDVNGDGFDDVIAGAPADDPVGAAPGTAFVYHGSASGLSAFYAWSAVGDDQAGAAFGHAVSSAGDVDGDGYDEVVIGANLYTASSANAGRAYVYMGSAGGLATSPVWAESGAIQAQAQFGYSAARAGDVNGDGFDEVLIGSPGWGNTGRAYLFFGQASGLKTTYDWHYAGTERPMAQYGWAVAAAGDVDGDGFADILVGAPGDSTVGTAAGRAFLYRGSSRGPVTPPDWSSSGDDQEGAGFGQALASAGDINADEADDFVVGAYWFDSQTATNCGKAYVYLGVKYQPGLCEPEGAPCDDSDPCTHSDACDANDACVGVPYTCEDNNACTDNVCLGDGTCSFPHLTVDCDDGNPCTQGDHCANAMCIGEPVDCSYMDDQCTQGYCDPQRGGCATQSRPDGTACEDGDPCTEDETCQNGVCVHQTWVCNQGKSGGCATASGSALAAVWLLLGMIGVFGRRHQGRW